MPASSPRTALPLAIALLLTACSDYGLGIPDSNNVGGEPEIAVTPRSLDFLSAEADETVLRSFTVANVGDVWLDVTALTMAAGDSFVLVDDPTPIGLRPGDWFDVEVAFTPLEAGVLDSTVTVSSTDFDEPEIPVSLLAMGLVPQLQISPDSHDFGDLEVPCDEDVQLTLQNVGATDLTLSAVELAGAGFTLTQQPDLPMTLAAGAYTTATVQFLPDEEGSFAATLTAVSTDPRGDQTALQLGDGTGGDPVTDRFDVVTDPPLDLLFAIDQSGSMDDDAASLGLNFQGFIDQLALVTTGWQIGVVTMDAGCINSGVLTASTPDLVNSFQQAVVLGDDLDNVDDEALLKLSDRALAATASGGCNEGLLREGAPLHIIVVSDEPERSHEQAAAWTWDFWLDALAAYVDDPALLTVSGIVDRDGCNEGDDGYAEAIAESGGAHLSLCDSDWADDLVTLAEISTAGVWSYALSDLPVDTTLDVTVDGAAATDWTWSADTNSVVFDSQPDGDEVTVTYQIAGTCE